MVLQIIGTPSVVSKELKNKVIVDYDPSCEITTITTDVDIVTLGIAIEILQMQYKQVINSMPFYDAHEITDTIRKAVGTYGQNSSTNC
jgi:hypothetical protein